MKKRFFNGIVTAVLCVTLALLLTACGGTGSPANNNDGSVTLGAAHGNNLAEWLDWLRDNAEDNTTYILPVPAGDSQLSADQVGLPEGNGITVDIRAAAPANIILNETWFAVSSGVTLRLGQNITLQGGVVGVDVLNGGTLIMENGAKIIGSDVMAVHLNGVFTMRGGTISGSNNAGVMIRRTGTFTMEDGIITQNNGDGVNVEAGIFIMQGGIISDNDGFGVSISGLSPADDVHTGGTFRISGGIIHGNSGIGANIEGALRSIPPELLTNPEPPVTARWGHGGIWQDIETPDTITLPWGMELPARLATIDMRSGVLQP